MKIQIIFLALFVLAAGAPVGNSSEERIVIDKDLFKKEYSIYNSSYEIINIVVPVNDLNFEKDDEMTLFFVLADVKENGDRVDGGLYVLKNGTATQLLAHGRDAACELEETELVYFGAKDGLYKYNVANNSAERFGSVADDIVALAKVHEQDIIYILTSGREVFKVTDEGTKKTKMDDIKDATQLIVDNSRDGNLYYTDTKKDVYVVNSDGLKKVTGLPSGRAEVRLIRPMFLVAEGVPAVVDGRLYEVEADGAASYSNVDLNIKLSAYGPEFGLIHYYAYDKQIYQFNILAMVLMEMFEDFKSAIQDMEGKLNTFYSHDSSEQTV